MTTQNSHASLFAQELPESVIKSLSIRVKEMGGINLGQGIPSFPTAEHIRKAVAESLKEKDIGVYPNFLGNIELREAIEQKISTDHAISINAKTDVLVTVGAMEATASAIFSIVHNGDRVGVITPDYCNHYPQIMLARGDIVEIPMTEGKTWSLNSEHIKKEAEKGLKLLILTNPNNPTGAVISNSHLKDIVRLSEEYGFWVLSDETYQFLSYESPSPSLLDFWDMSDRLITVRSFSKEYAMTGWRVGYVVAKPAFVSLAARAHDGLVGCAAKISQKAALAAISGPQHVVAEYVQILGKRRIMVCEAMDKISSFTYAPPQGAYYAFPAYAKKISSVELSEDILNTVGVAVIPGSVFGESGEGHIRISFAVDDDVLFEGMKRLKKYFEK